jgi:hypothetical protein
VLKSPEQAHNMIMIAATANFASGDRSIRYFELAQYEKNSVNFRNSVTCSRMMLIDINARGPTKGNRRNTPIKQKPKGRM